MLNPLTLINTPAKASPIERVKVVLDVGTMPRGSASLSTDASNTISKSSIIEEFILPTMPIKGDSNSLRIGISLTISSVDPLLEITIVGSPASKIPRSPCKASTACKKTAFLPILQKVAAIFCAISPDFPNPQIITFPL